MVMDTGSSLTWLQCEPCTMSCHPQVGPVFDPSASKTYRKLLCKTPECESARRATLNDPVCEMDTNVCLYTASYGDSSYSIGYLSQDVLSLKSGAVVGRFTYGCGQENVGLFGKSDGIVGLSQTCFKGKLSDVAAAAPAVGLVFQGGSILDVKAGNLLVDVAEEGISCLGFARSRSISIIGNRQQQTVNVAYDVGNSRIGFAPGGCR
ncbi:Aspartyl protease family protein At5g10770 [Linum perenne]